VLLLEAQTPFASLPSSSLQEPLRASPSTTTATAAAPSSVVEDQTLVQGSAILSWEDLVLVSTTTDQVTSVDSFAWELFVMEPLD